jgi:hypothetical protein
VSSLAVHCKPEPGEQLGYLLAITLVPAIAWIVVRGGELSPRPGTWTESRWLAVWALVVQVTFACFIVGMLQIQNLQIFQYFCWLGCLRSLIPIALTVLGWRVCCRCVGGNGRGWAPGPRLLRVLRAIPFLVAGIFVVVHLLPSLLANNVPPSEFTAHHLSLTMGEFEAVLNGRTPKVDFCPQYQHLLSYALLPVFRCVGLTVSTFSMAMVGLSALGFLLVFWVFSRVAGDPWKALCLFLPFLWASTYTVLRLPGPTDDRLNAFSYYAVGPLRYLGPWVTAAVLTRFLIRPSRVTLVVLGLSGMLAAINNSDFGLPAAGAALAAVLFAPDPEEISTWRSRVTALGLFATGTLLALGVDVLVTVLRSGHFPDYRMAFVFQNAFILTGFFMLPMPPLGLHWVVYATFIAAIIRGLLEPPHLRLRKGLLLYGGVFGCGALMYYVGRSHVLVLPAIFSAWAFPFLLLVWAWWEDSRPLASPRHFLRALSVPGLLLAFGYTVIFSLGEDMPSLRKSMARLSGPAVPEWPLLSTPVKVVQQLAHPHEKVLVMSEHGFLIAHQAGVDNVFPFVQPGSVILRSQLALALRALEQHHVCRVFGRFAGILDDMIPELHHRGFQRTCELDGFEAWQRRQGEGP